MIRRRDLPAIVSSCLTHCGGTKEPPIHIAVPTGLVEPYLVHLPQALGYFRDEELDTVIHDFAGSRQMESLLGGSSDAVYNSFTNILMLGGEARLLRSIFVGAETFSAVLAVSGKRAAQIQRTEDLKGATVGVSTFGSAQHQFLEVLLAKHGLTAADVTVVAHGHGPSAVASLQYGKVDAGLINGSAFNILKRRAPEVRILIDPRNRKTTSELTGMDQWPSFCLSSKVSWLEQNPVATRKLVRAMVRTLRWVHDHTAEQVRDQLPASLRSDDAAADLETMRILIHGASKDGRMPDNAPAGVLRFAALTNENVRDAKIDLSATYTNQFIEEATR